ncbi:MAG: hypothetical protein MJ170_01795 [Alphaproteobacteria bacterium]|nr:hypothetical protein [Alphaproteobacteria bacterium]
MNKIKEKFNNLRNSMPKGSMWLLLAAAFVVVIILLTLLLTNKKTKEDVPATTQNQPIMVTVTPDNIDFSDTDIDNPKPNATIVLSTNAPIKVENIDASDVPGLTVSDTCTIRSEITAKMKCKITFEYKPTSEYKNTDITANVIWHAVNDRPDMIQKTPIKIKIGAKQTKVAEPVKIEPVIIPEPEIEYEEPEVKYEPTPIKQEVVRAVQDIAPVIQKFEPEPVKQVPEACSDFALPGYDTSGVQIGWIKPEGGTYYFHPFDDKDCNDPTGIYNPDNGIITDIDNRGKKIGTDAEHIGYSIIGNGTLPQLQKRQSTTVAINQKNRKYGEMGHVAKENPIEKDKYLGSAAKNESIVSSRPYDRTFILRQFKPIPATIVSEIRADPSVYTEGRGMPVRATVDRNVYSDNGRTIILPAGTLLLGYLTGTIPGPYKAVGRMQINWYQFIRPDGVEFNFSKITQDPYSADAQGRVGVPGHGSTDYVEQIVMPLLTAMVPAAVNLIAPIADTFVNQIDLDNNTVVQSGTVRSSELAKNEVITAWNQVAQKLLVDALNNTTPPFSIAAGTRITVYSPVDLIVTCGEESSKECNITTYGTNPRRNWSEVMKDAAPEPNYSDGSWIGQVRSFNIPDEWCVKNDSGAWTATTDEGLIIEMQLKGYDYRTVLAYCQASNYKAINNAKQEALYQNQVSTGSSTYNYDTTNKDYNTNVLGLTYDGDKIVNPFNTPAASTDTTPVITCEDGKLPDINGCCTGEVYTDMGDQGFNCCPTSGGDCFPPIL